MSPSGAEWTEITADGILPTSRQARLAQRGVHLDNQLLASLLAAQPVSEGVLSKKARVLPAFALSEKPQCGLPRGTSFI